MLPPPVFLPLLAGQYVEFLALHLEGRDLCAGHVVYPVRTATRVSRMIPVLLDFVFSRASFPVALLVSHRYFGSRQRSHDI